MRRLALLLLILAGCTASTSPPDKLYPVGEFSLTERSGRTVSNADLAGRVWVAAFVFTCCTESCPQISGTMTRLQHEFAKLDDVRLVSFSVNPEDDTPEKLQQYAAAFGADREKWLFLTGDREAVYRVVRDGFRLGVEPTTGPERRPGNEVLHSNKLAVVDRQGVIRGYFDGTKPDELPNLKHTVLALLREKPS
jgi:cytochrome oxidase Cu insertion factor (SCO1/SenC/PrrC family)